MKIGMISTEFPPAIGGMQVMAFNLAQGLSRRHDLVVYTRRDQGTPASGLATEPVLAADIRHDLRPLASADVDVWLAMNAGYGALAGRLPKPMAVVCNGNDFLTPWVIDYPRQIDLLEERPMSGGMPIPSGRRGAAGSSAGAFRRGRTADQRAFQGPGRPQVRPRRRPDRHPPSRGGGQILPDPDACRGRDAQAADGIEAGHP